MVGQSNGWQNFHLRIGDDSDLYFIVVQTLRREWGKRSVPI